MILRIDPPPPLEVFGQQLELVICVKDGPIPGVYTTETSAKPDRHFLLGVVQTALIAIEESDPESVVFMDTKALTLERSNELIPLDCELVIARSVAGAFAVLTGSDKALARRLAREAARRLTGTIRLDIP
jgi:hypothetical protein